MDKKIFFSNDSSREVGSMCASMNRTGKTNAKKGPKVDFNAYKDFHDREIEAHIIASFMEFAGMKSVQGDDTCILSSNWAVIIIICPQPFVLDGFGILRKLKLCAQILSF